MGMSRHSGCVAMLRWPRLTQRAGRPYQQLPHPSASRRLHAARCLQSPPAAANARATSRPSQQQPSHSPPSASPTQSPLPPLPTPLTSLADIMRFRAAQSRADQQRQEMRETERRRRAAAVLRPSPSPAASSAGRGSFKLPQNRAPGASLTAVHFPWSHPPPRLVSALRPVLRQKGPQFLSVLTSDPHFSQILQPHHLHLDRFPAFVTPSRDGCLLTAAARLRASIASSSSSTIPVLALLYHAWLGNTHPDLSGLSSPFRSLTDRFTARTLAPVSATLRRRVVRLQQQQGAERQGEVLERLQSAEEMESGAELPAARQRSPELFSVWGLDRLPGPEDGGKPSILTTIGNSLEHLFTLEKEEYLSRFSRSHQPAVESAPAQQARPSFSQVQANRLLMRSQLDCCDPELASDPSSIFDIKTRATYPVRYSLSEWEERSGYVISCHRGLQHSFEREYYDMARAAFMRWGLQCRMGSMQGVMVAYHNTREIFGLHQLSRREMERVVLGEHAHAVADRVYQHSVEMLDQLMAAVVETANAQHAGRQTETIKLTVSRPTDGDEHSVVVFAELLPPPAADFDSHLPFSHRHATLWRLEQLDMPSLLRIADAHGLSLPALPAAPLSRSTLLSLLESTLSSSSSRLAPPLPHLMALIRGGCLLKFQLQLRHQAADGALLHNGRSWTQQRAEAVHGMTSSWHMRDCRLAHCSDAAVRSAAKEYRAAIIAGWLGLEEDAVSSSSSSAGSRQQDADWKAEKVQELERKLMSETDDRKESSDLEQLEQLVLDIKAADSSGQQRDLTAS